MDILRSEDIQALMGKCRPSAVSIYMPTHVTVPEVRQDPIRLKNLLDRAEELLAERGQSAPQIREQLAPAQDLWRNDLFWQDQSDGLALLIEQGRMHVYRLPFPFEPRVVVDDCFDIKPLLPLLSGDGRFYLLALRQGEVQLYQGSRYSMSEVDIRHVPDSLAEALRYDDPEQHVQFHTGTRTPEGGTGAGPKLGERPAVYHAQGVGADNDKVNIQRFFQKVDEGLSELLQNGQIPLLLAGISYLLPLYHQANTYPYLLQTGIEQDPGAMDEQELHDRAWAIVEAQFESRRQQAAGLFRQFQGGGDERAADDMERLVPAAYFERVDTLFVPRERVQWGTFDPETGHVELHDEQRPGDRDLFDLAAIHTLANSGVVYVAEAEDIPGDGPVAAVLRY